jgi:hypothetical protein
MKRTVKSALAGLGAAALIVTAAAAALGEGSGTTQNSYNRLHLGGPYNGEDNSPAGCGSIAWQDVGNNGDDSPIDSNDRALVAVICDGDFAEAYSNNSLNINRPVGSVKNISFDYRTNSVTGAGQVYILLVTTDGNYLYLDPAYCSRPIGGGAWSRADFTGSKTGCAFYDLGGTRYEANGTETALQVYQDAHPGDQISLADMVFSNPSDGPGNPGPSAAYYVDRIALGTNRLYNYSNTRAFGCNFNESRC